MDVGIDRDDLKGEYDQWVEECFVELENASNWWCCRTRSNVIMEAGTMAIELPSDYIKLTGAKTPITIIPTNSSTIAVRRLEVIVVPFEDLVRLDSSLLYPAAFTTLVNRRGFPVYLEPSEEGLWSIKTLEQVAEDITFDVSYIQKIKRLAEENDTNVITTKYPNMVKAKLKQIVFETIDDPRAEMWEAKFKRYHRLAVAQDEYERVHAQKFRMGGGSR